MYRCAARSLIGAIVALGLVASAAAQLRAFTPNTLRGTLVFGEYPAVVLNGKSRTLSPGSRVRNQQNTIVIAATLTGTKAVVNYTLDTTGDQLRDVWILTPDEAAKRPWPTTVEESRTWIYDPASMTWTKP